MFFTNLLEANLKVKHIAKNIFYYTATNSTSDDIWELHNLRRCQGICGPNHYIDLDYLLL